MATKTHLKQTFVIGTMIFLFTVTLNLSKLSSEVCRNESFAEKRIGHLEIKEIFGKSKKMLQSNGGSNQNRSTMGRFCSAS